MPVAYSFNICYNVMLMLSRDKRIVYGWFVLFYFRIKCGVMVNVCQIRFIKKAFS